MKKILELLMISILCVLLASCGNGADNGTIAVKNTTALVTTTKATIVCPPNYLTALSFDNFDEAKAFVETNDVSEYSEKDKANIEKMFDAFYSDGYLTRVGGSTADKVDFLFLGPQYGNNTPHISYRLYVGEASYLVTVWNADGEMLEGVKATYKDDFELGYFVEKSGLVPENWEKIEYGAGKHLYMNADRDYARFWIDGTHHVTVQATEENREALVAFISSLTFEKVTLEKAE